MRNINKILVAGLILAILIIGTVASVNADIQQMPNGFQRLRDVTLFNSSDLIPGYLVENVLIPNGFYRPLEEKINVSKILEIRYNQRVIRDILNHSPEDYRNNRMVLNKNGSNYLQSPNQDITFGGTIQHIWNYSIENGAIMYSQIVPDLDGDKLNDTLAIIYSFDLNTGLYQYTLQAKRGKDDKNLWQEIVKGNRIWLYGYSVNDLNGDGLSDVIVKIESYDAINRRYDTQLKLKKGINGMNLWKESISGGILYPYVAGDLNGDKLNDLLIERDDYTNNVQSLEVKKGIDGSNLWTESVSGSNKYLYGQIVEDMNGDSIKDILVKKVEYNSGISFDTLEAKKGIDGTNFWTDSISGSSVYLYGYSAGDIDDDGRNDILIELFSYDPYFRTGYYTLKAKRDKYGTNLWQESMSITNGWGYLYGYPVDDLNGDGVKDVLVKIYKSYSSTSSYILEAKKGMDGTNLWADSISGGNVWLDGYSAGDIDGGGTNDILVNKEDESGLIKYYTLGAKRGIDGYILWQESMNINGYGYGYIRGQPVDDLNGDRLKDVLVEIHNYYTNYHILKAKIKYGTDLWTENVAGSGTNLYGIPAGDLNGDRLNDVLVNIYNYNTYSPYTLKAKKGNDGTILWQKSLNAQMIPYPTKDLDGDKLNDILVRIAAWPYNAILANKGKNGFNIWKAEAYDDIWLGSIGYYYWPYPIITCCSGGGGGVGNRYTYDLNGDGYNDTLLGLYNEMHLVSKKDSIPPASITNLKNITYKRTYIKWTWKDPLTLDLSKVMVYINGIFKGYIPKGIQYYNATGLKNNTWYKISARTIDTSGNINKTWVNSTAKTAK